MNARARAASSRRRWWLAGGIAVAVVGAAVIGVIATRSPRRAQWRHAAATPALPGEPALTREHERILRQYTINLVARPYAPEVLAGMACKSERLLPSLAAGSEIRAYTRRLVALLRTPPEAAAIPCTPEATPDAPDRRP